MPATTLALEAPKRAAVKVCTSRIPALDAWRGIAILLVVVEHIQLFGLKSDRFPTGHHGVTAFFVLSGFLITGQLIEPGISLRRFYIRRLFRLMPAAWAFLALISPVAFISPHPTALLKDILACVLFARNFTGAGNGMTAHFWSLSIEEQFYLFWPTVLVVCGATRAKWIAASTAVASALWCYTHQSFYNGFAWVHTEAQAPSLLIGCLLAIVLQNCQVREQFVRVSRWLFWPCVLYLAWVCVRPAEAPYLLESAAWGVAITHTAISSPNFLNWAVLTWLGRVSYSLYIWNTMSITIAWQLRSLPAALVAITLPLLSYYAIERPGIKIGNRLLGPQKFIPDHRSRTFARNTC